jgi:hypothetical protein
VETGTSIEPYRETSRRFNNRAGSTPATQRVSVSEQWTQSIELSREHAHSLGGHVALGAQLGSIASSAESTLRAHYGVTADAQRTYTDELTIEIPPHTLRTLHLEYKRVFQAGLVRASLGNDVVELPYRAAVALEMNWSQHDEPAPTA